MGLQDAIDAVESAASDGTTIPADALKVVLEAAKRIADPCPWCRADYTPKLSCTNCGREHD